MKILLFHPALMDYRLELFELLNNKYDITFIFTKQGRGQDNVQEKHLKIPKHWKYKLIGTNIIYRNRDVGMYFNLIKELLMVRYDVLIVSNNWYICWPIAKVMKKKYIFWTESWYWPNTSKLKKLQNLYTRYILRHVDRVIATGSKAYNSHLNLGVCKEKIDTYPQCSVDYSNLSIKNLKKKMNLENNKIILFVGRIVEVKGLDYLIKSFSLLNAHLENTSLVIIGSGPCEESYKKLASESNINNIYFMGNITDNSLKASIYNMCDVFVLPSIFFKNSYEPWGLVLNEVMAFGKPVVTTDAVGSGLDLVINGYNGYIVKNKNIHDLYRAIYSIISDEKKMQMMGLNSRKIFEKKNDYKKLFETFSNAIDDI